MICEIAFSVLPLYHRLRSLRSDGVLYEGFAAVDIWGIKGETPRARVALRKIIVYSRIRVFSGAVKIHRPTGSEHHWQEGDA